MKVDIVTVNCAGPGLVIPEGDVMPPGVTRRIIWNNINNWSPCESYQQALIFTNSDVIIYCHDDLTIHDPKWLDCVTSCMCIPTVVAVGLGGATGLGTKDLYRKPANIRNLARQGYASNQTDAEVHGERRTGFRGVVVIEQFFMAIRTNWLRSIGGWPTKHLTHHCLDMWLACEAARHRKDIYMVGVSCTHHGGGSSTKPAYKEAVWLQGGTLESDHQIPHRWIYENYRDVLPLGAA
jgi:hypothetical protein